MQKIHLEIPTIDHKKQVMEFRDDFLKKSHHIPGAGGLESYPSYSDWLLKIESDQKSQQTDPNRVPATLYIALDEDSSVVGVIQLRHQLSPYLLNFGGHIGYSVSPKHRRQGYASSMLQLCLQKAASLGIESALITCDENNTASEGVIVKAGGVYEDTRLAPDNIPKKRFWVATTSN